jgi:hypothetical protein
MMLEIGVADLAASRFAVSPLGETVTAIQLLAEPGRTGMNAPWVRWARAELASRPVRLTRVWPLAFTGLGHHPEFLIPAPAVRAPDFGDELARLRATPEQARSSFPNGSSRLFPLSPGNSRSFMTA